ncbi:hypothetical protein [Algoriphagus sp.]|uniref:hypothetical protein n=1 Tax=Algoriphagus sp. TaxID=1872435 RepID=UPI00391B9E6E
MKRLLKFPVVAGILFISFGLQAQDSSLVGSSSLKSPNFQIGSNTSISQEKIADLKPDSPQGENSKEDVRPFITDDSRVVGNRLAQMEAWMRIDKHEGQQWLMAAYGPNKWLELSIGGVLGYEKSEQGGTNFSYALPLVQGKVLFREYESGKGPGFGAVLGSFFPGGKGAFKPEGYGTFGFLTVSQCFGENEDVLIHGNLGANYLHIDGSGDLLGTWGFGSQVRVHKGMHLVGEIFSGDPYVPGAGISYQVGYRYFFSDLLQIDMTIGEGMGGESPLPFWFSAGVRIVTERFLPSNKRK